MLDLVIFALLLIRIILKHRAQRTDYITTTDYPMSRSLPLGLVRIAPIPPLFRAGFSVLDFLLLLVTNLRLARFVPAVPF
jgi:hypothetical protein